MSKGTRLFALALQASFVALLLGAWHLASTGKTVSVLLLPPLPAVGHEIMALALSGRLWAAAQVTLATIAAAFAIAALLGIVTGFLIGRSARLTLLVEPLLAGLFAVPITLFFPLFILFFGIGPASKVAYGAAYGFFPVALSTIAACVALETRYVAAARAMGARGPTLLRHVYLPGAMPAILGGLRIGFFITVAAVLGGETLSSASGVGRAIALSAELMETARMYAWIAFVVATTVMLNLVVSALEARNEAAS